MHVTELVSPIQLFPRMIKARELISSDCISISRFHRQITREFFESIEIRDKKNDTWVSFIHRVIFSFVFHSCVRVCMHEWNAAISAEKWTIRAGPCISFQESGPLSPLARRKLWRSHSLTELHFFLPVINKLSFGLSYRSDRHIERGPGFRSDPRELELKELENFGKHRRFISSKDGTGRNY